MPEVLDAAGDGADRTEIGMVASSMSNLFTTDTILLCGKLEDSECGAGEIGEWRGRKVEASGSTKELDVTKVKRMGIHCGDSVFTRTH